MREEVKRWLEKAKEDLDAAEGSLKNRSYDWACFQAQQAAEKALKALYIKRFEKLWKIHDLTELAKKLQADTEIMDACIKINPSYAGTRYPDVSEFYTEKKAKEILELSKKVVEWTKKNL